MWFKVLSTKRVNEGESFQWQSQLKFEWGPDKNIEVSSRQFCRFHEETDQKEIKM